MPGCTPGEISAFELRRIDVTQHGAIAEDITMAVAELAAGQRNPPDPSGDVILSGTCRKGAKRKLCHEDFECDTVLGAGNGVCDTGTGVLFKTGLGRGVDQRNPCTSSIDVVVGVRSTLKLKSLVRPVDGRPDRDSIRLKCKPTS